MPAFSERLLREEAILPRGAGQERSSGCTSASCPRFPTLDRGRSFRRLPEGDFFRPPKSGFTGVPQIPHITNQSGISAPHILQIISFTRSCFHVSAAMYVTVQAIVQNGAAILPCSASQPLPRSLCLWLYGSEQLYPIIGKCLQQVLFCLPA